MGPVRSAAPSGTSTRLPLLPVATRGQDATRQAKGGGRREEEEAGATKERVDAGAASRERAASRRGGSTRLQRLNDERRPSERA